MRKLVPVKSPAGLLLPCLLLCSVSAFAGGIDLGSPEISLWYELIDSDIAEVEEILGDSHTDIAPSATGSRADRILWYEEGVSLWIDEGRVVQLRLDSSARGSVSGISIGSPPGDVVRVFGRPWIEADENMYYNLPWRSGPVRLRLIFTNSGLSEIYLYIVR